MFQRKYPNLLHIKNIYRWAYTTWVIFIFESILRFDHIPLNSLTGILKKYILKPFWSNYTNALQILFRIRIWVCFLKVDVRSRHDHIYRVYTGSGFGSRSLKMYPGSKTPRFHSGSNWSASKRRYYIRTWTHFYFRLDSNPLMSWPSETKIEDPNCIYTIVSIYIRYRLPSLKMLSFFNSKIGLIKKFVWNRAISIGPSSIL